MKKIRTLILATGIILGTSVISFAADELTNTMNAVDQNINYVPSQEVVIQTQLAADDAVPVINVKSIKAKLQPQITELKQLRDEQKTIYKDIKAARVDKKTAWSEFKKTFKSLKPVERKAALTQIREKIKIENLKAQTIIEQIKGIRELKKAEWTTFRSVLRAKNEGAAIASMNKIIDYKKQIIILQKQLVIQIQQSKTAIQQ